MESNELNVCYCCNNDYAPYVGISLTSLLKNNLDFEYIYIYIIYDEISDVFKDKLNDCVKNYSAEIIFIKFPSVLEEKLLSVGKDNIAMEKYGKLTLVSYYRLFLSSLIDEKVDRIIYLDADTLVLDSLKNVWNIDLKDKSVAGVIDYFSFRPTKAFKLIKDLDENIDYINAGFMILDLNKWRKNNLEKEFLNILGLFDWGKYLLDQGMINYLFKGNFIVLNPKYNLYESLCVFKDYLSLLEFDTLYDKDILLSAIKNPVVLHFPFDTDKPWVSKNSSLPNDIFKKYVDLSPFNNEEVYISKNFSLLNNMIIWLRKVKIFFILFNKIYWKFKIYKINL
ncbi:MAG: glycosyltransferase family 8 protein [Methanobrevibacter sp.]|jgi:lipopolysaccharide biosynthesis glycosyltransferase|nr:glycosyltransferase family 8 protein [Candidatus Methanoflexus mossambicus]